MVLSLQRVYTRPRKKAESRRRRQWQKPFRAACLFCDRPFSSSSSAFVAFFLGSHVNHYQANAGWNGLKGQDANQVRPLPDKTTGRPSLELTFFALDGKNFPLFYGAFLLSAKQWESLLKIKTTTKKLFPTPSSLCPFPSKSAFLKRAKKATISTETFSSFFWPHCFFAPLMSFVPSFLSTQPFSRPETSHHHRRLQLD